MTEGFMKSGVAAMERAAALNARMGDQSEQHADAEEEEEEQEGWRAVGGDEDGDAGGS
jgi:hypothetical protein